jgi:hypothetical protein
MICSGVARCLTHFSLCRRAMLAAEPWQAQFLGAPPQKSLQEFAVDQAAQAADAAMRRDSLDSDEGSSFGELLSALESDVNSALPAALARRAPAHSEWLGYGQGRRGPGSGDLSMRTGSSGSSDALSRTPSSEASPVGHITKRSAPIAASHQQGAFCEPSGLRTSHAPTSPLQGKLPCFELCT